MPNKPAAIKALRQTKKRTVHNNKVMAGVEVATRLARKAVAASSKEAANLVKAAVKALDRAAQKGVLKANNAARKKSRLMKALGAAKK